MDRATLVGVYGFLGFVLCKSLLENGIEVTGVFFEELENDDFAEEKRLEIGRNSNFEEVSFKNWLNRTDTNRQENLVIVSVYDLFMTNSEDLIMKNPDIFSTHFCCQSSSSKFIVLLPANFAYDYENRAEIFQSNTIQAIYLPTLFGPWQSEEYIFQQTFYQKLYKDYKPSLSNREWLFDAIYIEDSIQEIIQILDEEDNKNYFLSSQNKNNWVECAKELSIEIPSMIQEKDFSLSEQIEVRHVNKDTDLQVGLKLQLEHLKRVISSL